MAGTAKPDVDNLGSEINIDFLKWFFYFKPRFTSNDLKDGNTSDSDTHMGTAFFDTPERGDYLVFKVQKKCRIWAYTNATILDGGGNVFKPCKLFTCDENGNNKEQIGISNRTPKNNKWYILFDELEPGIYRIESGYEQYYCSYNEWYAESLGAKCLVFYNQKYLTIENNTLKEVSEISLESINTYGVAIEDIMNNINLFNKGKIKIYTNSQDDITINAIKSKDELVTAANDFPTTIQSNIDYFENKAETSGNGAIKIVFSIDSGTTWKTYRNGSFEDMDITIPNKEYASLTDEEKIQWDNATQSILYEGISYDTLKTIDFNTIDFDKIRFAYVLHLDDITSVAINNELIWQFDSLGSMFEMKDSEYDLEVLNNQIKVTTLIDNSMVKVNILPNGIITENTDGGTGDTEDPMTDSEIDTLVNNVLA